MRLEDRGQRPKMRIAGLLLVLSLLLNNNPIINLMGVAIGYVYAALADTWLLGTPIVLRAAAGEHYD